ncbi:MAG: immune inhibitor A, partial [Bacteroidia bacterium]|nr:immune inhibitor A [Bacteroidia bacterium]
MIDGIAVIHEGPGQEATMNTNDVWSHTGDLSYDFTISVDGVSAGPYTMQPELLSSTTSMVTIGVMVHEFGHNLGLPDMYATDYSSDAIGEWDPMASGSWLNSGRTPCFHNAWSRYVLGWIYPVIISSPAGLQLRNAHDYEDCFRINTTTGSEYFLLENRQNNIAGTWDRYLPGHGMLAYHIDGSYINSHWASNSVNNDPSHQGVDLEEADNTYTTNNGGDGGDPFPGTNNKINFTDNTTPNMKSWANANTGKPVTNIQEIDTSEYINLIIFDFMGGNPPVLTTNFYSDEQSITVGGSVNFTSSSTTPVGTTFTSFQWTFQGGSPGSYSGETPPAITYNSVGTYNV